MIQQVEITLKPKSRGFHLVTSEIMSQLPQLPKTGIMNIFCKHTSDEIAPLWMESLSAPVWEHTFSSTSLTASSATIVYAYIAVSGVIILLSSCHN